MRSTPRCSKGDRQRPVTCSQPCPASAAEPGGGATHPARPRGGRRAAAGQPGVQLLRRAHDHRLGRGPALRQRDGAALRRRVPGAGAAVPGPAGVAARGLMGPVLDREARKHLLPEDVLPLLLLVDAGSAGAGAAAAPPAESVVAEQSMLSDS